MSLHYLNQLEASINESLKEIERLKKLTEETAPKSEAKFNLPDELLEARLRELLEEEIRSVLDVATGEDVVDFNSAKFELSGNEIYLSHVDIKRKAVSLLLDSLDWGGIVEAIVKK